MTEEYWYMILQIGIPMTFFLVILPSAIMGKPIPQFYIFADPKDEQE